MYTKLGEATLKTGERMEMGVVACPDPAWAGQVAPLLGHKTGEWRYHVEAALQQPLDDLQTLFYLGIVDGVAITNVMIVGAQRASSGCGILGHVYTRPEHRQKGAYSQLMAVQMEHVRQIGYRVLTLGTGFESHPYWIYHSFGFRSIDGTSGRMKWLASPGAEAEWFRPGETRVRPMRWDDWAPLNLVASQLAAPDEELPRSYAFRLKGHGSLEGSFLHFRRRLPYYQSPRTLDELRRGLPETRLAALTLTSERGAAVGWAVLQPDDLTLGESWLLDCYVHPAFRASTEQLLAAVPWPEGKRVVAYSSAPDGYRAAALRQSGFQPVAELPRWLQRPPLQSDATPEPAAEPLRVFVRPPA